MNIEIETDRLYLKFSFWEQVWAVQFNNSWEIPLSNIELATTEEPQSNWKELKAPGTFLPGVIKAGTYYTNRGKEFWYVTKDSNYLTLVLRNESYQKIILTLDNNEIWVDRINNSIGGEGGRSVNAIATP